MSLYFPSTHTLEINYPRDSPSPTTEPSQTPKPSDLPSPIQIDLKKILAITFGGLIGIIVLFLLVWGIIRIYKNKKRAKEERNVGDFLAVPLRDRSAERRWWDSRVARGENIQRQDGTWIEVSVSRNETGWDGREGRTGGGRRVGDGGRREASPYEHDIGVLNEGDMGFYGQGAGGRQWQGPQGHWQQGGQWGR